MKKKVFHSPKKFFWQLATVLGIIILFASPLSSAFQEFGMKQGVALPSTVSTIEARDIYPMFTCPCCGQPLNKEEPCCGAMTQMIDFIDQKVSTGANKDDVILATAIEFGLERLAQEQEREVLREKLLANAPKDAPKIVALEVKKDLGVVSLKKGIVTTKFIIKNEGMTDLVIGKLSSSCGCTSASLVYQGKEGPRFYMAGHGQESPDDTWNISISPGTQAQVKVYYDPTVHPDLIGPVTRQVLVHSNDPVDFEIALTITLNQEN